MQFNLCHLLSFSSIPPPSSFIVSTNMWGTSIAAVHGHYMWAYMMMVGGCLLVGPCEHNRMRYTIQRLLRGWSFYFRYYIISVICAYNNVNLCQCVIASSVCGGSGVSLCKGSILWARDLSCYSDAMLGRCFMGMWTNSVTQEPHIHNKDLSWAWKRETTVRARSWRLLK